jgi:hypothetical protein
MTKLLKIAINCTSIGLFALAGAGTVLALGIDGWPVMLAAGFTSGMAPLFSL